MEIKIHHLDKTYRSGVQALDNVTITIPNGMFGLLGPNGAGKTTLMRILAGILRPTKGMLQIGDYDGNAEKGRNAIKRILGYLPQDFGIYPDLSAREFLDYIGILKGLDNRFERQQSVDELLEVVSLTSVSQRKLKTFSGGMKRRIGIAQALLNNPELLIVDEPTAGLDPEERIRFRNLLSELGGNRTILLSTHIVEDIAQTCQKLAIMKDGHLIFQGTVADLISKASTKVWLVTTQGIKYWTGFVQSFLAVATGLLLADRLPRDRRTKIDELLNTLPSTVSVRIFGKYLGSTIATLVPMVTIYSVGITYILVCWHSFQELPLAIATFAAIALPGVMFIGAFSIACTSILWVPLYQILFVGYWFWGNLLPNVGIPTLSTTILTPVGGYMCTGFFNPRGQEGICSPGIQGATAIQGAESIFLLVGIALLIMLVLIRYLKWKQGRQ